MDKTFWILCIDESKTLQSLDEFMSLCASDDELSHAEYIDLCRLAKVKIDVEGWLG